MPPCTAYSENLAHACVVVLADGDPFHSNIATETLIIPIKRDAAFVGEVRARLGAFCAQLGMESDDVKLAGSETVTNTIRHALPNDPENAAALIAQAYPQQGEVTIHTVDTDPASTGIVRSGFNEEADAYDIDEVLPEKTDTVDEVDVEAYLASLPFDFDDVGPDTLHEGRRTTAQAAVKDEGGRPEMRVAPVFHDGQLIAKVVSASVLAPLLPSLDRQRQSTDLRQMA